MIRLNLLQNRFSSSVPRESSDTDMLAGFTTSSMAAINSDKGKRIATIVGVVFALCVAGAGAWYLLRPVPDASLVPEAATVEKPVASPETATKTPPTIGPDSAKHDSEKAKDTKPAPKPVPVAAPLPKPEPKPVPKKPEPPPPAPVKAAAPTPPPAEVVAIQPSVVAPALAGGVVDLVLGESKASATTTVAPSRFEDLSPLARLAYQRFAFERILTVIRQVTPPDVRFTRIRILSPGIVTLQGNSKETANIALLIQGLLAQSMVDTALVKNANGQFALMARLPFSASFAGSEGIGTDFKKTIIQVRDLAATQGLDLGKPAAPRLQSISGMQRARWTLNGTGGWEAVSNWISALQSTQSPIGFTYLSLAAGPDGKLRLDAEAISYGK